MPIPNPDQASLGLALLVAIAFAFVLEPTIAAPMCQSAASDPDGDGWGWENQASCIVSGSAADVEPAQLTCKTNSDSDGDGWGWEDNRSCRMPAAITTDRKAVGASGSHPPCVRTDSDPDGDGFGWENEVSCHVQRSSTAPAVASDETVNRVIAPGLRHCASPSSDPDRDGIGWENNDLCASGVGVAMCDQSTADPDGDGFGLQSGKTCIAAHARAATDSGPAIDSSGAFSVADITDVVLVTGQSNVLGSMTTYDAMLDQPDRRVFAWTSRGWQQADLHQVWDRNGHPGNFSQHNPARQPYNNFAFHFGRELARLGPDRVPAFIVVSAPGKGISHWDRHGPFYRDLSAKVRAALSALPHRSSIDGILWHQGETDWQFHGTSDPLASGIAASSPDYPIYYRLKLQSLIADFRSEPWSSGQRTLFICGETRLAEGVNRHLMALNDDTDPLSGCVLATDLPARDDDHGGSHFSAAGLRELGVRYARMYRQMRPG